METLDQYVRRHLTRWNQICRYAPAVPAAYVLLIALLIAFDVPVHGGKVGAWTVVMILSAVGMRINLATRLRKLTDEYNRLPQLKAATQVLIRELKNDPEFYYAWQSNIAMAFVDECRETHLLDVADTEMFRGVCNRAAQRFLNTYIR